MVCIVRFFECWLWVEIVLNYVGVDGCVVWVLVVVGVDGLVVVGIGNGIFSWFLEVVLYEV